MLGVKLFGAPSTESGIEYIVLADRLAERRSAELIDADSGGEAPK